MNNSSNIIIEPFSGGLVLGHLPFSISISNISVLAWASTDPIFLFKMFLAKCSLQFTDKTYLSWT